MSEKYHPYSSSDKEIKKRSNKYNSSIYEHFFKFIDSNDKNLIKMKYVRLSCHKESEIDWSYVAEQKRKKAETLALAISKPFSQGVSEELLIDLVIKKNLPFNLTEDERFKNFISSLRPEFNLVGGDTIKNRIIKRYDDQVVQLREYFKTMDSKISFCFDIWSVKDISFLGVTGHWIDSQFKARKCLLGMESLKSDKTEKFDISKKIMCTTSDNCSNNHTTVENIVKNQDPSNDYKGFQGGHILCLNHVINLGDKSTKYLFDKIHSYGSNLRNSSNQTDAFFGIFEILKTEKKDRLKPKVLNPIRWSSAFQMTSRFIRIKDAVDYDIKYKITKHDIHLTTDEWDIIKQINKFLDGVDFITLALQGADVNLSCSLPVYGRLLDIGEEWKTNKILKTAAEAFWKEIDGYYTTLDYGIEPFYISTFLAPFTKLEVFKSEFWKDYWNNINNSIESIYTKYGGTKGNKTSIESVKPEMDRMKFILSTQKIIIVEQNENELSKYKNLPTTFSNDSLQYWKENQIEFPVLSRIARDYLAIQCTSTPAEIEFRYSSDMLTKNRWSLGKTVIKSQKKQFILRMKIIIDLTKENKYTEEIIDLTYEINNNSNNNSNNNNINNNIIHINQFQLNLKRNLMIYITDLEDYIFNKILENKKNKFSTLIKYFTFSRLTSRFECNLCECFTISLSNKKVGHCATSHINDLLYTFDLKCWLTVMGLGGLFHWNSTFRCPTCLGTGSSGKVDPDTQEKIDHSTIGFFKPPKNPKVEMKSFSGMAAEPSLDIDPTKVPPDTLYMFMSIVKTVYIEDFLKCTAKLTLITVSPGTLLHGQPYTF
ncbi:Zinc finger BED domain-containing protein [Heterostelium album PN500]|uniref:Zinc finger BED domain-containing protein n=1 Tax=Heterostelium pallidum (strain ATCC 26659 / Pp 5 / PN500) TaxID=670386 RepID=D3B750_HETP5|nr:Zinc finger BED domain-containing protein [Heterostelium album PN500]EFA82593.1 Zinc finger BED domain-containing protein [Heterostelium album PN500]|eukprot:XP_020434710.1 Zinc finger BED domain-containing protein [Heterostelium album PN500]